MKVRYIVAAALLSTGLVFAQEATTPAATATTTTTTTTTKTAKMHAKAPAAAAKVISGSIVSVDAIGNTVIVKAGKTDDTLSVNDSTKVKVGGKDAKVADLAADMKVTAYVKVEDGKKVATKIYEKAAAGKKKAAKTEETK